MECSVGEELEPQVCNGTACVWRFWYKDHRTEGDCRTDDFYNQVELILLTEIDIIESYQSDSENRTNEYYEERFRFDRSIDVWCRLNNCNNKETGQKVQEAAQNYYLLWAPLRDSTKKSSR